MSTEIASGWKFYNADFSVQASGCLVGGSVRLIRSPQNVQKWHEMDDDLKDSEDGPELYVQGTGFTIEEAIASANVAAFNAKPIPTGD